MSKINGEMLWRVMDHIVANPDEHDQDSWARYSADCGTTYCFAGWACVLAGYEMDWHLRGFSRADGSRATAHLTNGELIAEQAMEILGLNYDEAEMLFYTFEDAASLKDYVSELTQDA